MSVIKPPMYTPIIGQDSQLPSSNNYPLTLLFSQRLISKTKNLLQFKLRGELALKSSKNEYSFF